MATIRLTNAMRENIALALIVHRFSDEVQSNMKERAAIAHRLYDLQFSDMDQRKMLELPKGWLNELERFDIHVGGETHYCYFNGRRGSWDEVRGNVVRKLEGEKEPVKKRFPHSFVPREWSKTEEVIIDLERTFTATKAIYENVSEALTKATSAINQYYTIGGMIKEWPEIEPFVPKFASAQVRTLPVLATQTLNSIFNLPVS